MATIATAYVQVMPSMEGATENITGAIAPQLTSAGSNIGASFAGGFAAKAGAVLKRLAPAAIVGTTATAAAKQLLDLGQEFDTMTDAIIVGTGEQGAALDSLVQSAKNIATTVPTSFENAGDIVQNLRTRLGLTGQALEDVGSRAIEVGNILGESVDLDKLTGAFNTFGVSADDAASKMDYLFNVGQATGIGFNDLTGTLEKNAPVLKQLGFSFEESANMAGMLDKAGLDASGTMGKLAKVLQESADQGIPAREAYEGIVSQMQEYLKTGDEVAALDLAQEVFGVRGSAQFLDAVKQGTLSLDAMKNAALGAGDGIMGTMERTEDWPEKWERIQNRAKAALAPLAGKLMDGVTKALGKFEGFITKNSDSLGKLGSIVENVAGILGGILGVALDAVGVLFEALEPVIGVVADAVQMLGEGFQWLGDNVISPFIASIGPSIDNWATGAQNAFKAVGDFFTNLGNGISQVGQSIGSTFGAIGNTIKGWGDGVMNVFTTVTGWIQSAFQGALDFLSGIPNQIIGFFSGLGSMITDAIGSIHFPLPHVSFENVSVGPMNIPLPHVEWYARGGIVDTPTLIGAGEAGKEAVVPLTQPALAPFAKSVASEMDTDEIVSLLRVIAGKDSNIYLDGKTLVGGIASRMDSTLGTRRAMTARGLA